MVLFAALGVGVRLFPDELSEPLGGGLVLQGKVDGGLQEAAQVAGVVPVALKVHRHHPALAAQLPQTVGELDLPAIARIEGFQHVKDLGGQHVPAQDGVVGKHLLGGGLFVHVGDLVDPALQRGTEE